jgi:hypothetical protein
MIQATVKDLRGNVKELTVHDREYWEGPYRYEPFPKVLFRATGPEKQDLEERIVKSESEMEQLGRAWKEDPDSARAFLRGLDDDVARAAAETHHANQRMSERAREEFLAADRATDDMITDVPAPKKRGRPAKAKTPIPA